MTELHRTCKDPQCHNLDCLVQSESEVECHCDDPRDCASAEPCFTPADLDKALALLDGPWAMPMSEYSRTERIGIRRVAKRVYEDRILNHRLGYGEGYDQALHDVRAAHLEGREAP